MLFGAQRQLFRNLIVVRKVASVPPHRRLRFLLSVSLHFAIFEANWVCSGRPTITTRLSGNTNIRRLVAVVVLLSVPNPKYFGGWDESGREHENV